MPIRLLHFSDIHFGGENVLAVEAARAFAASTRCDLIVISGDITQYGSLDEFAQASAWLARLPGPVLSVPGNHDTPWMNLWERIVAPFSRYARAICRFSVTEFMAPGLAVYGLNSARGWQIRLNWSKGAVSRRQTHRARRYFREAPLSSLRILVCHHPLVEFIGEPMTARVRGGRFAARSLAEAEVDLVLTGHLHSPFVQALPFGDAKTLAVGAGTLSLRERGDPPSFSVLDIEGSQVRITNMAWDGLVFSPSQEWVLPLRDRGPISAAGTSATNASGF